MHQGRCFSKKLTLTAPRKRLLRLRFGIVWEDSASQPAGGKVRSSSRSSNQKQ